MLVGEVDRIGQRWIAEGLRLINVRVDTEMCSRATVP